MAAKTDDHKSKPKRDPKALEVVMRPGDDHGAILAQQILRPTVQAALTLHNYSAPKDAPDLTLGALIGELADQCERASAGDLRRAEATLTAQAHTLDAIFHVCARRAAANMGEYPQTVEIYMRLALKAQSQCRATLETLAAIKNPSSVAFVRQANIAHGPQQINNGIPASEPSRAEKTENAPSKLLEAKDGERLDTRAASAAGGANPPLETVGAVDGANDGGGQS